VTLLTYQEAADRLGVSLRTIQREAAAGKIRVTYIGRRPRILEAELEKYLAASTRRVVA